ncbi:MAG: tripartite tricarboxylate transporter TctB family protein [Candidatus Dactylopiibacterium sp.]|nr:tripartite tricarboxylate transporter TctB family protein [Candidatus Dactylopiibacterium sp.]
MLAQLRQKDFLAGLLFLVIGAVIALEGAGLAQGSASRMGPGYLPLRLGVMLASLGFVIALQGLRGAADPLQRLAPAPLLAATLALVGFGLAIEYAGLIVATALLVAAARLINWRGRVFELVLLVLVLAAIVVAVFRYGLGVPVELWPSLGD